MSTDMYPQGAIDLMLEKEQMSNIHVTNATIKGFFIGVEDHNILTMLLHLEHSDGDWQSFGNYNLLPHKQETGPNYMGVFIREVLNVVGCRHINDLVGKNIRIHVKGGLIVGIQHIIKDELVFYPGEVLKKLEDKS